MATKQQVSKSKVGTQTKQPKFDHHLFETGVIGSLKSFERGIDDNTDNTTCMIAMNEAIELFQIEREYKPLEELGSAVMALQAFNEWLEGSTYRYEPPVYFDATGFTVQIVLPNGSTNSNSVFQLHCTARDINELDKAIDAAYKTLTSAVTKNYKPAQKQEKQQKQQERETDEEVEFEALRVEKYQGKTVYRLIPVEGRWTQHGVALYSDEARKAGIDLSEYQEEGDYELSGTGDIEYKPDGKPMRWARINIE